MRLCPAQTYTCIPHLAHCRVLLEASEPVELIMARREAQFVRKATQLSVPKLIALLSSPHAYKRPNPNPNEP